MVCCRGVTPSLFFQELILCTCCSLEFLCLHLVSVAVIAASRKWESLHLSEKLLTLAVQRSAIFFVKTLFGRKEGIVNRFGEYEEDRKDKNGIPKLYIRKEELAHHEVSHLALLIFAFCLLAGITAWDVFGRDVCLQ